MWLYLSFGFSFSAEGGVYNAEMIFECFLKAIRVCIIQCKKSERNKVFVSMRKRAWDYLYPPAALFT